MWGDLEALRHIFRDERLHIGIGVITRLGMATDFSILRVQVNLLPENREIVAYMGMADVYDVTFPETNDLVIVAFVDGHPDEAHVIARYNSKEELIPQFARTGDSVKYARPGKKLYLGSETKVGLGRPNVEPTEPLVLGLVMQQAYEAALDRLVAVIDKLITDPVVICSAPGQAAPAHPTLIADLSLIKVGILADKNQYSTTTATNFLAQKVFTERGV